MAMTKIGVWHLIDDIRGEPDSAPMAWWFDTNGRVNIALDEALFDDDGKLCGKGGCGADLYTHVRIALPGEIPDPPEDGAP